MRKQIFKSGFFLKCLMVLLAIGWSTSAVWAEYWQLRVVAVCDGLPAESYVAVRGYSQNAPELSSNDYTMPAASSETYTSSGNNYPKVKFSGTAREGETFVGWYLDPCCTQLLKTTFQLSISYGSVGAGIQRYTNLEDVQIQTIYAKFTKGENVDWTTVGKSFLPDIPSAGKYYIRHFSTSNFLCYDSSDQKLKANAADINDALLFTLTSNTTTAISTVIDGNTYYLNQDGSGLTASPVTHTIEYNSKKSNYRVRLAKEEGSWYWSAPNDNVGITTYATGSTTATTQGWYFIPEDTVKHYISVYEKKSDGSVTISESPTAQGTAYVSFRVSTVGNASQHFTYSLSDETNWVMGEPTRCDNIITVPVTYTAQNIHSGTETPASTTTVTITSTASSPTQASATASAYVDLRPDFEMAVSSLDWSTKQEGEEIYNVGMEVAASQRARLQNKLVYSSANLFAQNATWTATITNDAAGNFKFANGTQSVSGPYSAELLDVIYAPKAAGTHSATLHVEVSYTDANSTELTCERNVTLSGKAQNVSMLTMTLNNSETSFTSYTHALGNIIGTNSKYDTIDLYIHGVTDLSKSWSASEGAFEFDANTIDLDEANQRLIIRAHRSTPVTEDTPCSATLTVSGKNGNADVSATFTLNYTAKPLIPTTVTWNWTLLNEDATYTNPITTNSDGEWTLVQRDGNGGMTYNAETKSITTEYMHHESGYVATFEFNIPQTDTYTARVEIDTFYARINAYVPPVIEIKNQADVDEYVVSPTHWNSYLTYDPTTNAIICSGSNNVYFQWSGQSTFAFDYEMSTQYSDHSSGKIYGIYEDDTQQEIFSGDFYNDSTHLISVPPTIKTLRLNGNNTYKNIRYFEYDTIDVNYHGVVFVDGGATTRDITATFANKREVTVSLNAAAQPYFELRAEGKPTGSSLVYDNTDGLAVHKFVKDKVFTVAIKDGVNYADAKAASVNGFQVILQDNYTYNSEVVVLPIALEEEYTVTYKHDVNGSYKVTYHDDMDTHHAVSTAADYVHTVSSIVETSCTATLSEPVPASGYMFRGWKVNGNLVSCKATFTVIPASGATVEPVFVATEEAVYGLDNTVFADLDDALSTAGSIADTKPVVVLLKDVTLEAATHTIPVGVTLLIPYKDDFNVLQTTPEITTTDEVLSAYRTLTLKEGANIVCNGTICVSGKIKATGGGFKSAYTTGECGVINMATGGHIELNNGAELYCWGYIKGQDMDQGNNTVGTGTITVNNGAIVHENFELGDWRGGTASSNIYYERGSKELFPFQSYALQNVEIPTTYTYGSKLETFMAVNTGFGSVPFAVSMIGSQNTLFLLQDEGSVIRKWYDPTTDLTCYELSGTAQLDELVMNLPFVGNFKSGDCNLPVSNSMHVILANCDMTLSKPLTVQAGAVLEIKNTATVDLTAKIHLFDVDEWGLYIHNYYFRSFNNLTSHKNRGAENSKAGLEDAKFIIDGTLNVKSGQGYIYSTEGGANLMGNGGGKIVFEGAIPAGESELWHVTVLGQKPYITWVPTTEKAANLCNEDGSYTPSTGYETYYNINGRWFRTDLKDINDDHTYTFEYISTNTSTDIIDTLAIYSHDKTGLTERMKWFNVEADENCENWWVGANPAALYNYTMLGEWHQFMAAEGEGVYSGSNNMLYQKDECQWVETGAVDENCLYTFEEGGVPVKKALVNGHFIPLTSNGYDPAYHKTDDATKYYICFQGCNWHPATPYTGESKAYTIEPETDVYLHYIWFEGDWLNVQRDEPFFYTEDEVTNVRTYYEYVNGEWEIATPYVSVTDAAETRNFYMIKEAFNVASIKKNATITLLRDLSNVSEVLTYTTQNTTCTLDLNGHLLAGDITNMITVNAPGATFTITDNSALTSGKISNAANKAVYVQKGTLVVTKGTIESGSTYAIDGATTTAITINGGYFAAGTQCAHTTGTGTCSISGGHFNKNAGLSSYAAAHKYPFETTDPKYQWEVSDAWTITFKQDETVLLTLHLKPGEMPIYTLAAPTKEGYKFTGWDAEVVAAVADATYTAQFEVLDAGESCVTLNANGGKEGLQYVYVTTGEAIGTVPAGTTKDGYTFVGWFDTSAATGGNQLATNTVISGDVTYYARYSKNSYTLTWNANGGVLSGTYTENGSVQYGTAITKPTATFEGHTFIGWDVTPATTMPAHDVTYTAQWSIAAKHYKQNLADDDYTLDVTENVTGEVNAYVTPAVKTYDGFISPAAQTVKIGETTEVTYNYARRTYTITLDVPEGSICETASVDVKHGATIETLPVATMTGRAFLGWFTKATGGDQITNETVIQRNIGTLYAQFSEANMDVTAPTTISDDRTMTDLRVTTTGKLTITGNVTVTNFILESNGETASGQFVAGHAKLHATNAYFDLKLNTPARHWHAFGVPWAIGNLDDVKLIADGTPLTLGRDYDIIWYDGAERATNGPGTNCWKYVEHNGKTLTPGVGYMIAFTRAVNKVRFTKASGASILYDGSVTLQAAGDGTNKGINAVANPMVYHANMDIAAVGVGQVHDGGEIGSDGYEMVTIAGMNYIVGKTVYVQVDAEQTITPASGISPAVAAAPARRAARATDKKYMVLEDYYTVALTNAGGMGSKLYVLPEEDKENKYVIGHDLFKMGMSDRKAQIWVNRYGTKLGLNTTAPVEGVAEFPINLYAPAVGEYTISNLQSPISNDDYVVYLTQNGEAIWNLSESAYSLNLNAGVNKTYGLRLSAKAPQTATAIDEAVVDAQGDTRKVLINNQVFIIRGDQVYSIDGQLVK